MSNPFVSIIIPVFNDNKRLKNCLQALEKQTYPQECYEIIVVDNGSQEDVKSVVIQFSQTTLAYENCPGSYVARNKGISLAKGEAIAFTDADCIPDPDWIEKGVAALVSEPNIGLIAGRIDLFVKDPSNPNPIELYESIAMSFPQDQFLKNKKFGVTANLFTWKKVLDDVGAFDATLKSGGDVQWGQRVFAKGYQQLYANDARVNHPARNSWACIRKRSIRIVGGRYDALKKNNPSAWDMFKDLILFLKPPFRSFFHIWTDKRLHGPKQKLWFTIVMLCLRGVAIHERLRLQLFGCVCDRG
jgi:glycosyltransferase involved in cell wall biosynthesis